MRLFCFYLYGLVAKDARIYAKARKGLNIARGFNHGMRIVRSPQSFLSFADFCFYLYGLVAKDARIYAETRKVLNIARGFNHGMRIVRSPQSFLSFADFLFYFILG